MENSNEGCSEEHLKHMTYHPFQDVSVPQRRKKPEDC